MDSRSKDFDNYGATRRTPREFFSAWADLSVLIRDIMVPNPEPIDFPESQAK